MEWLSDKQSADLTNERKEKEIQLFLWKLQEMLEENTHTKSLLRLYLTYLNLHTTAVPNHTHKKMAFQFSLHTHINPNIYLIIGDESHRYDCVCVCMRKQQISSHGWNVKMRIES